MYRSTSLAKQYYERRGKWSLRPLHSLGDGMPTEAWISGQTLKEQYVELKTRLSDIDAASKHLWRDWVTEKVPGVIYKEKRGQIRKEREDLIRQVGRLRNIVEATDQLQFERVLAAVVEAHLERDVFLKFVEEARKLWRENGNGWLNPTQRQKGKRRKHASKMREVAK